MQGRISIKKPVFTEYLWGYSFKRCIYNLKGKWHLVLHNIEL